MCSCPPPSQNHAVQSHMYGCITCPLWAQLPGVLGLELVGLDKSSFSRVGSGVELFAGCPRAVSHRGFPTGLLECASHPLRPERVMLEGVTEDLSSRPSDGGPDTADRLGGPRWRGTLFLWLLYFFGLWLFDNSSKNSL